MPDPSEETSESAREIIAAAEVEAVLLSEKREVKILVTLSLAVPSNSFFLCLRIKLIPSRMSWENITDI